MAMPFDLPRAWDGRVREVVSVRYVETSRIHQRVECLSCGHEQAYSGEQGVTPQRTSVRICRQCPGMAFNGRGE